MINHKMFQIAYDVGPIVNIVNNLMRSISDHMKILLAIEISLISDNLMAIIKLPEISAYAQHFAIEDLITMTKTT